MNPSDTIDPREVTATPPRHAKAKALLRRFLVDYAMVVPINTVCAIFVTYVLHIHEGLWGNWVFSMCIGTVATLLMDGARLALWGEDKPLLPALIGIIVLSAPIAYFLGSLLAIELLGLSAQRVLSNQIDHATSMLIFVTTVCLFVSWIFWSRSELSLLRAQAEAEKAKSAAVERQAMQAQLQLLQAQIEPHMLFNTLANLQGLIAIDPPRAQHMLDQLIHYMRATLSSARADKTTLAHEFDLMRAYLELMSVRMGARLSYTLQLPPELDRVTVPPMLLQPLLENAIKHGLESKIEGGHIDVTAKRHDDKLTLTVSDTGLGLEATNHAHYGKHGTHVGLANVRERLFALYGEQAEFKLCPNTPAGAIAELILPLSP
jgi:signal transduction histidine kinase